MPDVVGQPSDRAVRVLERAGLATRTAVRHTSAAPAGAVLRTNPAAGAAVTSGDEVTLTVAEPLDFYDLAERATWQVDSASVDFPARTAAGPRKEAAADLEDGTRGRVLVLRPSTPRGSVSGDFPITDGIVAGDHLLGEVGFLQGAAGGSVEFAVTVNGHEVYSLTKEADGVLQPIDVDLTGAQGATTVRISVVGPDHPAVWKDLRIETQGK